MNEENKVRKLIITALASVLIGTLLFIFGLSIQGSPFPMIINYIIAIILYIAAFLALYNNHKDSRLAIYKYLMILVAFFIVFVSFVFIYQFLI